MFLSVRKPSVLPNQNVLSSSCASASNRGEFAFSDSEKANFNLMGQFSDLIKMQKDVLALVKVLKFKYKTFIFTLIQNLIS